MIAGTKHRIAAGTGDADWRRARPHNEIAVRARLDTRDSGTTDA